MGNIEQAPILLGTTRPEPANGYMLCINPVVCGYEVSPEIIESGMAIFATAVITCIPALLYVLWYFLLYILEIVEYDVMRIMLQ